MKIKCTYEDIDYIIGLLLEIRDTLNNVEFLLTDDEDEDD